MNLPMKRRDPTTKIASPSASGFKRSVLSGFVLRLWGEEEHEDILEGNGLRSVWRKGETDDGVLRKWSLPNWVVDEKSEDLCKLGGGK